MKRVITIIIILLPVMIANAQWKSFTFKAGYYTPYDLKSGFIYGLDYGFFANETVAFLISGDLYYREIRNDSYLGSSERLGIKIREGQRLDEWVGWHFPVTAKLRVEFPVNRSLVSPFAIGGVGYGLTRVSYETYDSYAEESDAASLTYHGMVWQIGGGIMYYFSRNSSLLFEIMHNSAVFEKEEKDHYFTEMNSSGVIFRLGINFSFY